MRNHNKGIFLATFVCLCLLTSKNAHAAGAANLADSISKAAGVTTEEARGQIKNVTSAIKAELKEGNAVTIRNFGRFYVQNRDARVGRNPRSGEKIDIPAKRYPKFRSSDNFKAALN